VQKIVIEIGTKQTRLFQCNRFHCADFHDWNRDRFISSFWKKIWQKSTKINHRTNMALSELKPFFGKWLQLIN